MTSSARTAPSRRWQAGTLAAIVLCIWLAPSSASAQSPSQAAAGASAAADGIRGSLARLRFDSPSASASGAAFMNGVGNDAASLTQRPYRGRPRGRGHDRAVVGLVLGALGGMVVGGVIGIAVVSKDSCSCDDPALHGFAIGAPIGAVVGGFLGYAVAR